MEEETRKTIDELSELENIESKVRDNKLFFEHDGQEYRIRTPSVKEQVSIQLKLAKKSTELLKNSDIMLEETLIKMWKDKGVDIEEYDRKFKDAYKSYRNALSKLGEAVSVNGSKEEVEALEKKVLSLREDADKYNELKTKYVLNSYERIMLEELYRITIAYVLEKKEGDGFIKAYTSYQDFMDKVSGPLLEKAMVHMVMVKRYDYFD